MPGFKKWTLAEQCRIHPSADMWMVLDVPGTNRVCATAIAYEELFVTEWCTSTELYKRREAVMQFNAKHRYKKRGIYIIPTKYGISFINSMLN
jgi:xanthine dehydrogenase molybdopterin-binding subunit B